MKKPSRRIVVLTSLVGVTIWYHYHIPEPTILSFRIGEPFDDVAKESSFPVIENSNNPDDDPGDTKFGLPGLRSQR